MGIPKSVIKINKGNVKFISNVDRVNYTLNELTRAALRDTVNLYVMFLEICTTVNLKREKVG